MATEKLKLGIIGISEGNGHPYSWAAIFNGYDVDKMEGCPYPIIPQYLAEQDFPKDFLQNAEVTHIWTQDIEVSNHIAKASRIPNVATNLEDMIGHVDAVLLARDDAENHFEHARPFLQAGLPIYIDKPFALTKHEAERMWGACVIEDQIFTCSALQFAEEFSPSQIDYEKIGEPRMVIATVPKSWNKYGVHIIEPLLNMLPQRGKLEEVRKVNEDDTHTVYVKWSNNLSAILMATGSNSSPLGYKVMGTLGYQDLYFKDSFNAFKSALDRFVKLVNKQAKNIDKEFTLEMIEILEKGNL